MSGVKLYYYINSPNITMTAGDNDDKFVLRLSLLTKSSDGIVSARPLQNFEIHRHLIGWHSQQIPISLMNEVVNDESIAASANVTVNFRMQCLNCDYHPFPESMTKQNVPFLKVDSRRRRTRRNGANACGQGRCCPKELIVDFNNMGWDWVLFPKRYIANYCEGTCSNIPRNRASMSSSSHIINAMLQYLGSGKTSSCCVPNDEEFIENFTYMDQMGNIKTAPKILRTINSCRCT